ncbi:MAG: hypothetical protein P8Y45_09545 [Exilibacterium sp.]
MPSKLNTTNDAKIEVIAMLYTLDLSTLLGPVMHRAQAGLQVRIRGFTDRSAAFVLEQIGVPAHGRSSDVDFSGERLVYITRCSWIDRELIQFFSKASTGEGIEIAGALSTRFHRLSEQLDWPQFSWCAINTRDINDCLQFVFPAIDKLRCIGCDKPMGSWQKHVHWPSKTPKILIVGEQNPVNDWEAFACLYDSIQVSLTNETPCIELIVAHAIDDFQRLCDAYNLALSVASTQPLFLFYRESLPMHPAWRRCKNST